jgi:hypothetical protein
MFWYAGFWEVLSQALDARERGPAAASSNQLTAATPGQRLRAVPVCRGGTIGIVGITVSPANPDRLWAIVEAEDGGVFRAQTTAAAPGRRQRAAHLRQRAWYYTRIYADPKTRMKCTC